MKYISKVIALCIGLSLLACESLVDGINDNPNELIPEEVQPEFYLNGALLANSVAQAGHLNRIAGMWSGQLTGFTSLYSNIYGYSISTAEAVSTWSRIYVGTIPNVRYIRQQAENDALLRGIAKVVEAHAIGTAASLFGDVPYSQINDPEIEDPVFDSQSSVFRAAIDLLDDAVVDLQQAVSRDLPFDIHFEGDADKWQQVAGTLKARYYLQLKEYANAFTAAQQGISSPDASMLFYPRGDASRSEGDKNLFWTILEGSRAGDIGTGNSYLIQLLDAQSDVSRNNAKTDETARLGYYTIKENNGKANTGIIEQFEPHKLVTYEENLLILAEAGARTQGFDTGLRYLNDTRAYLNTGDFLNENFIGEPFRYDPYVAADFQPGGIENPDNIDPLRALLREIIEERYVSGFGMFIPFNDARRLRKSDSDIAVPFPLNNSTASQHPERLPYSADELVTNSNAPRDDPGIFTTTEVNQ